VLSHKLYNNGGCFVGQHHRRVAFERLPVPAANRVATITPGLSVVMSGAVWTSLVSMINPHVRARVRARPLLRPRTRKQFGEAHREFQLNWCSQARDIYTAIETMRTLFLLPAPRRRMTLEVVVWTRDIHKLNGHRAFSSAKAAPIHQRRRAVFRRRRLHRETEINRSTGHEALGLGRGKRRRAGS